jgi:hypothetical protein
MIDVKALSVEDRAALMQQLQADQEAEKIRKAQERDQYRDLVNMTVNENIIKLQKLSSMLSLAKADVYNSFTTIMAMKKEVYGYKDGQQSHSFTDDSGRTIEIGFRIVDGWNDTVEAGISKVNTYIESLATNEETGKLVRIIQNLLKKDAKGNLKANRVLELQKLADDISNPTFKEGVEIISSAYIPVRSAWFIEASVKDRLGKKLGIPLSITAVDFPDGMDINTESL